MLWTVVVLGGEWRVVERNVFVAVVVMVVLRECSRPRGLRYGCWSWASVGVGNERTVCRTGWWTGSQMVVRLVVVVHDMVL